MPDINVSLSIPGAREVGEIAGKVYQDFLAPTVREAGLDLREGYRGWRQRRAEELLYKTGQFISLRGIGEKRPVPPKILDGVLAAASLEDDEMVHDMWAALLANAASSDLHTALMPAFIEILKQLSAKEAALLDFLYGLPEKEYYTDSKDLGIPEEQLRAMVENLERLGLLHNIFAGSNQPMGSHVQGSHVQFGRSYLGSAFLAACAPTRPLGASGV